MRCRDGTRSPGPDRRRRLRRLHRPQGPGAEVRPPVPGADLRLRVPPGPLLRQHRRGGDPGRACRSSSGNSATGRSAAARRNCSRPVPARTGSVKIIDIISARLDAKTDSYLATLPSLQLKDVQHREQAGQRERADADRRLLRRGRPDLRRRDRPGEERHGRSRSPPCGRSSSRSGTCWTPSTRGGRGSRTAEWKHFLLRSVGLEPTALTERQIGRAAPPHGAVRREQLQHGRARPAGTGKSHLFQQISPYAHLVTGGKATVARMFVNNATGQRGLVCQYDVVCFDEVSGVSFDQKDGVNIMKGYMESGEFSRGKESIRAYGSIVMVGNFDVDVRAPAADRPPVRPDAAGDAQRHGLMDRIHCYLPGWDVPKISEAIKTDHFGLVSDFLSECWSRLRGHSRVSALQGRVTLRRCPERPRPERREQDGQRAAEADPPVARRSRPRRGPGMGRAAGPGVPAPGEGAAEADRPGRVPQHAVQLHPGQGWGREVRGHARTPERGPHRPRPAAAGPGLGHQPRRAWTRARGCTGSRSPRGRAAASAS